MKHKDLANETALSEAELKHKVKDILLGNRQQGYSRLAKASYDFIKPAANRYPFQYFWDTCFHVLMLCDVDEVNLAKKQMVSLFQLQEPNGFIGHMIFWRKFTWLLSSKLEDVLQTRPSLKHIRPQMSALTQPSLIALAVKRIYETDKDKQFLAKIVPKITAYLDWLDTNRNFDGDGLLGIITPYESGVDYKPSFDKVLGFNKGKGNIGLYARAGKVDLVNFLYRYNLPKLGRKKLFIVKDVIFNTFYAQDLGCVADLLEILGMDGTVYRNRASEVTKAINNQMYSIAEAAFFDIDCRTGKQLKTYTPSILFPLILPGISSAVSHAIVKKHFIANKTFGANFPITSTSVTEPSFLATESHYIWRGPTWVLYNWVAFKVLKKHGYDKQAIEIRNSTLELINKGGFREYYNPSTGQGYGANNFTWSGLVLEML